MNSIDEKEKKLNIALEELKNLDLTNPELQKNIENLSTKQNQLEIEKTQIEEKYKTLLEEHENLAKKLEDLKNKEKLMYPLSRSLLSSGQSIKKCKTCGNLGVKHPCKICSNPKRDKSVVCVVEDISDLWALEKTGSFKGLYHVLGGSLSALDNITPDDLMIKELIKILRIQLNQEK